MSNEYDAPITKVLLHYFPEWEVPENRKDWNLCLCPSHVEDRPSCSVNFDAGAVSCKACGFKGDVLSIIRKQEGGNFATCLEKAKGIVGESYDGVSKRSSRKPRRKVFGESRTDGQQRSGGSRKVPDWLRR